MSAISLSPAAQSATSSGSVQAALQQAKRIADQAESAARTLEEQATSAQANATSAQEYASSLTLQANQAQLNVGWTQQSLTIIETVGQLDTQISSVIKNVVNAQPANPPIAVAPETAPPAVAPVVNTQGQVTGKIINTSA
jgi:hypothetical protein